MSCSSYTLSSDTAPFGVVDIVYGFPSFTLFDTLSYTFRAAINASFFKDLLGGISPNSKDVRKRRFNTFLIGDFNSEQSSHGL